LINKPTLNVIDEDMMTKIGNSPMGLVVESYNKKTGLGSRFGSWLLERGLTPKYAHIGTHIEGCGGLWEQFPHQGIDPEGIMAKTKALLNV
jgi:transketolase C-terminal domain/subunit